MKFNSLRIKIFLLTSLFICTLKGQESCRDFYTRAEIVSVFKNIKPGKYVFVEYYDGTTEKIQWASYSSSKHALLIPVKWSWGPNIPGIGSDVGVVENRTIPISTIKWAVPLSAFEKESSYINFINLYLTQIFRKGGAGEKEPVNSEESKKYMRSDFLINPHRDRAHQDSRNVFVFELIDGTKVEGLLVTENILKQIIELPEYPFNAALPLFSYNHNERALSVTIAEGSFVSNGLFSVKKEIPVPISMIKNIKLKL